MIHHNRDTASVTDSRSAQRPEQRLQARQPEESEKLLGADSETVLRPERARQPEEPEEMLDADSEAVLRRQHRAAALPLEEAESE
jgi:hypothetical protein